MSREQKIQYCCKCDEPTERCEDDSIYSPSGVGPLCIYCYRLIDEPDNETDTKESAP